MADIKQKLSGKTTKLSQMIKTREDDHPARLNNYKNGSFYNVDINMIIPDPTQPRKHFDQHALEKLSESIRQQGVLQPIIIRKDEEDNIYLVAGERRYRAAKMAGLTQIPGIISTGNPAEIALIENIQRENLNSIEEAEALHRLIKEYNYTQEQLSGVIGKARTTITESLSLNNLPPEIKDECRHGDAYSKRLLVEVVKQESPKKMVSLFEQIKKNGLKSEQVRKITRKNNSQEPRLPSSLISEKILALTKLIKDFDFANTAENEKDGIRKNLHSLKETIEAVIN